MKEYSASAVVLRFEKLTFKIGGEEIVLNGDLEYLCK